MPAAHDRLATEFTAHRPHLLAVAYRLTGSVADAEDAVQEAWLRLVGQAPGAAELGTGELGSGELGPGELGTADPGAAEPGAGGTGGKEPGAGETDAGETGTGEAGTGGSADGLAPAGIRDLPAWLTTVVGRICLDRLRSAAVRRERYVGSWLPEPVVTPLGSGGAPDQVGADPLEVAVRDDGVRLAALVVLDRLSPEQRVAFVLHDAFDVPFAEIAATLGCSVAAARQHASRGRRIAAEAAPPPRVELAAQRETLERFLAALSSGDLDAVVRLLHPEATLIGDAGGRARTALHPVTGADKVARFLAGLLRRYGPALLTVGRPVLVNGELGLLIPATPGDGEHQPVPARVAVFSVQHGLVTTIYDMANPDKLGHVTF
ncbi:sigma-70 family RNA polymerase sigma factor [Goodfellowiella coeruleoviolacea]|uniref:SnoaL-like domain-containing protein n=1 Tax=Goodfellowiella coeruleoviolacea TaxID=334858 RepID=A0AAE3GD46_9PSEU|nr:sigma-70 family RNA polymerase sigma factor [Goodfellowiella coeruleoviolacea]MCP2165210.1 SnoaL-like domain-containing protein [Goodfellowiella coeruleoviolacea]